MKIAWKERLGKSSARERWPGDGDMKMQAEGVENEISGSAVVAVGSFVCQQMPRSVSDLRPSQQGIEALLNGTSLNITLRRAVVDSLQTRGLLFGSVASSSIRPAANYRLSTQDLDIALSRFDEQTRTTVMSVLSQVGALA